MRASGPEMVRALDRVAESAGLGAGDVEVAGVSPGRLEALARQGLSGNAAMLRRAPELRRRAVLLATVREQQVTAVDDALDLFAVLMASRLLGPAERDGVKDRLHSLPQLRQASVTLAVAGRVLLQFVDQAGSGAVDVQRHGHGCSPRYRGTSMHGRYAFSSPPASGLRPPRDPLSPTAAEE